MRLLVLLLVILLLAGVFPGWSYSRDWGYGPVGGLGTLILVVVLVLYFTGRL